MKSFFCAEEVKINLINMLRLLPVMFIQRNSYIIGLTIHVINKKHKEG